MPLIEERFVKAAKYTSPNSCTPLWYQGPVKGYHFGYRAGAHPLDKLIGTGNDDSYSKWKYVARCCLGKPCCLVGQKVSVGAKCIVLNELWDKFQFDDYPQ